jgi:hypothetical protein
MYIYIYIEKEREREVGGNTCAVLLSVIIRLRVFLNMCHSRCVNAIRNNKQCIHNTLLTVQKATCFGCTRQPSSGFTFQKYKKGNVFTAVCFPFCISETSFLDC